MWVITMFHGDNNDHVKWLQHAVYNQALWTIVEPCQEYTAFACRMLGENRGEELGVNIDRFDHRTLQDCAHDILAAVWRYKFRDKLLQLEIPFDRLIPPKSNLISHLLWEREVTEVGKLFVRELDFRGMTEMSERMLKHQEADYGVHEPIVIRGPITFGRRARLAAIDLDHMRQWLDWLRNEVRSWKQDPHLVRYVMTILTNQNQSEGYKAESFLTCDLIERFDDVPWPRKWASAVRDSALTADEHYT